MANKPIIGANPAVQGEYGPHLDYGLSKLKGYQAVFVLSDREFAMMEQQGGIKDKSPAQIKTLMQEMYPDQPVGQLFKTDADYALLKESLLHAKSNVSVSGQEYDVPPEAGTLRVGTNEAPVRIGFINLPEKHVNTPESFAPSVRVFANQGDDASDAVRRNDTKAFTVRHEFGHLADEEEKGTALVDFDPGKQNNNSGWRAEVVADRSVKADLPEMKDRGLIQDPATVEDIGDSRKIETFHDLVKRGEVWTVGKDGSNPGKVVRDNNLDDHASGFSLNEGESVAEGEARMRRIARDIADMRGATLDNMYEQASDGKSTPLANHVYQQVHEKMKTDPAVIEKLVRGRPVDPEEAERIAFNTTMTRNPAFIREMADGWQKTPSLSEEARGMAGDYAVAYDHMVKGMVREKAPAVSTGASSDKVEVKTPAVTETVPPKSQISVQAAPAQGM